jgi:hypothetical protein
MKEEMGYWAELPLLYWIRYHWALNELDNLDIEFSYGEEYSKI